jgi:Uma2 family endonuclease
MGTTAIKLTPADHGRRMSLADFEHAEVQEGRLYELGRGIVVVSDVPKPRHLAQLTAVRRQLAAYDLAHPGRLFTVAGGSDCKILLPTLESERHPDLALYKTPPPSDDDGAWRDWVPEVVIEIVSPGSEQRDYHEKSEEYLAFGVREYWVFDADRGEMLVLRRSKGAWVERVLRPPEVYRTRLLPGLEFACGPVFEAARAVKRRGRSDGPA